MRKDPLVLVWSVHFGSAQALEMSREVLRTVTDPTTEFTDEVRTFPFGYEILTTNRERIGDFFEEVRASPGHEPLTYRLVFRRRPDAPRRWKDVMGKAVRLIQDRDPNATVTMEYRGDEMPVDLPVGTSPQSADAPTADL